MQVPQKSEKEVYDYIFKMVIIGNASSGKSSLLYYYIHSRGRHGGRRLISKKKPCADGGRGVRFEAGEPEGEEHQAAAVGHCRAGEVPLGGKDVLPRRVGCPRRLRPHQRGLLPLRGAVDQGRPRVRQGGHRHPRHRQQGRPRLRPTSGPRPGPAALQPGAGRLHRDLRTHRRQRPRRLSPHQRKPPRLHRQRRHRRRRTQTPHAQPHQQKHQTHRRKARLATLQLRILLIYRKQYLFDISCHSFHRHESVVQIVFQYFGRMNQSAPTSTFTHTMYFNDVPFTLPQRWLGLKLLGAGSYGNVLLALDNKTNKKVAIKKLNIIEDSIDARRALREIRILRLMRHPNIVNLMHCYYDSDDPNPDFGCIYLIQDYYPADLYKVTRRMKDITDEHVQFIMYQLVKGLHYIHSVQILHRDIKPSNILASEDCEVCYCDFGLARQMEEQEEEDTKKSQQMTEYVVTRFYRAPEVMLSSQCYSLPLDVWALGCTFAELLNGGKVLFKGQGYVQMIKMIFDALGKPPKEELSEFITNKNAREFVDQLPVRSLGLI